MWCTFGAQTFVASEVVFILFLHRREDQRRGLLSWHHSRHEDDRLPPGHALGRRDFSGVFKRNAVFANQPFQAGEVFAGSTQSNADGRQESAIGLADAESVCGTEASNPRSLLRIALVGRFYLAHERGKDHEALFPFLDEAAQRTLRVEASDAHSLRTLASDQLNVLEVAPVESRHGCEVVRERIPLFGLSRFDGLLDGLICDFLDVS